MPRYQKAFKSPILGLQLTNHAEYDGVRFLKIAQRVEGRTLVP